MRGRSGAEGGVGSGQPSLRLVHPGPHPAARASVRPEAGGGGGRAAGDVRGGPRRGSAGRSRRCRPVFGGVMARGGFRVRAAVGRPAGRAVFAMGVSSCSSRRCWRHFARSDEISSIIGLRTWSCAAVRPSRKRGHAKQAKRARVPLVSGQKGHTAESCADHVVWLIIRYGVWPGGRSTASGRLNLRLDFFKPECKQTPSPSQGRKHWQTRTPSPGRTRTAGRGVTPSPTSAEACQRPLGLSLRSSPVVRPGRLKGRASRQPEGRPSGTLRYMIS